MDVISYALSKKIAAHALSGVQSMSINEQTLIINTKDSGVLTMTFPTPKDGISVTDIDVNANNQIVFTMSDGSEFISGKIPTVKGEPGFSPTITENADNTDKIYKLDITTADSTFTTPNLKGADGQGGSGSSGEENVIDSISVNGVNVAPDETKNVNITVPTVTNDLTDELKSSYDDAVAAKHTHDNKTVLDKLSENSEGALLFNGNQIEGGSGTSGKSAYEIAVDNGFVGTETEWLESLKGSDGDNGITPHINSITKNWFIGDTDTGVLAQGTNGKDGKSIKFITKDENNNIITTFTDGTTQNIGQLTIDVEADFLTEIGFGNLRYYNGELQYYDDNTSSWVNTSITPDNVYIMNMIPQPMQKISCIFDTDLYKYKLKWKESADTVIGGQVACLVDKVIIRRKLGSAPTDENDGDLVIEVKRKDFGLYKNTYFIDEELTPNDGDVYYYKAFPVSTTGFYNYSTINETSGILCKNYNLFGFILDQNESDPASMITYIEDNKDFASAYMDYTTDSFNYGDWGSAWFIRDLKPCMLKYDGTVDYELDPNDYTKKTDGTDSDVANDSYGGNAMVGIPKVYWKIVDNGDNTANIYICEKKLDSDFNCWSHIGNNGNEIDYCYMPIYTGSNVNNVLRSISGKVPIESQTVTTEITYAKANNLTSDIIWYTEVFSDRMLINLLLLLIGKSTSTQTIFGNGNYIDGSSASSTIISGTMDDKGLFYGTNGTKKGVKVFGMEHWWGNQYRRVGGWINDNGTQKIKMTYGQSDGSTVDGYNTNGTGYIIIPNSKPSGTNGGYISKVLFNENGLIPITTSGSATTYYCDGLWFNNSQVNYAMIGGSTYNGNIVGAFFVSLDSSPSAATYAIAAALSCKPLAQIS